MNITSKENRDIISSDMKFLHKKIKTMQAISKTIFVLASNLCIKDVPGINCPSVISLVNLLLL